MKQFENARAVRPVAASFDLIQDGEVTKDLRCAINYNFQQNQVDWTSSKRFSLSPS